MTVDELIQDLEEARDELGGDAEIRVAYQPSWPLRTTIARVTIPQDDRPGDDEDEIAEVDEKDAGFCWIALTEGQPYDENPYAPKWAWEGEPAW
jgi:hypothetical protein